MDQWKARRESGDGYDGSRLHGHGECDARIGCVRYVDLPRFTLEFGRNGEGWDVRSPRRPSPSVPISGCSKRVVRERVQIEAGEVDAVVPTPQQLEIDGKS